MSSHGTGSSARLASGALAASLLVALLVLPAPQAAARTCAPPPGPGTATSVPVLAAPTQIRWTRVTRWLTYGAEAIIEGQVVSEEGARGGARVDLYARPSGAGSWTHIAAATSDDESGVFSFGCVVPERTTAYRVEYAGDGLHAPSSATRTIDVARAVLDHLDPAGAARFRLTGTVSPRYAGLVLLQHRAGNGRWTVVDRDRADRRARFDFDIDVTRLSGAHDYRAVVPADDGYLRSPGTRWRITVS